MKRTDNHKHVLKGLKELPESVKGKIDHYEELLAHLEELCGETIKLKEVNNFKMVDLNCEKKPEEILKYLEINKEYSIKQMGDVELYERTIKGLKEIIRTVKLKSEKTTESEFDLDPKLPPKL